MNGCHQGLSAMESLLTAIKSADADEVEKLLKGNVEREDQNNAFHMVLHTANVKGFACLRSKDKSGKAPDQLRNSYQRVFQVLLESDRFNVAALGSHAETALHVTVKSCDCTTTTNKYYKDQVDDIIKLLLKKNANINAKTSEGETALMKASERGCSHIVQLLLDWRDELGAGVDMNARDIYGETALIKAAKWFRVDVVKLLLQSGCLDKYHDHRGFYALHAVIYGPGLINDVVSDFLGIIGVDKSIRKVEFVKSEDLMNRAIYMREVSENFRNNGLVQKIVTMLVSDGHADINSLDFRGNTVLDLAVKSKWRICQQTINKLVEYGAKHALLTAQPKNHEITFPVIDKMGKSPLHRLSAVLRSILVDERILLKVFLILFESSPYKEIFQAMAVRKDYRDRTALHYAVLPHRFIYNESFLVNEVLKLRDIINERDCYGRTALHYCHLGSVYETLVERGADEYIKDIDGKTPKDLRELRKLEEERRKRWPLEEIIALHLEGWPNRRKSDVWKIWKDSEYAYRDPFSLKIRDKVRQFVNRLTDEIGKRDPRFECRSVLIGSAEEGTKTGLPDEFDFNFILTRLSALCEVIPSPEAPSGFVHLKRRYSDVEYELIDQSQEKFDGFFNSSGFLLTTEIACRFSILYLEVMNEPKFWENEHFFEWDTGSEAGLKYIKMERRYEVIGSGIPSDFIPSTHLCSSVQLKLNRPIEGRYMFTEISLDIAPCIQINGWWPEEALSGASDEIKAEGYHLVFDQPQRKYPWVPFSDPFARISLAPTETRIIKECSAVARAAYMIGKQLLYYEPKLTYVLKTCLLYCIEAQKGHTKNNLLYEDIDPVELRIFVEKLMLCFLEFYRQDFCPCYLMPSFKLPIGGYFKSNHDRLFNDSDFDYPHFAYSLYFNVCAPDSVVEVWPPIPEPLCEKFNRNELMRKLSMDRLSVQHQSVEVETVASGPIIPFSDRSGSPVMLSTNRKRRLQTFDECERDGSEESKTAKKQMK